ncbi:hypothetical protein CVT26_009818 [Gymnopilus dilepis]|uniref:Transcription activator of gluconeogenesis ERT1 n=1 Tax=Gymnopilus dilepis TaxID=231916 RepID=A0A409VKW5_9AGAR|nr:hypothetical protein CVT26_009818 [Gymnopilus dilepis]
MPTVDEKSPDGEDPLEPPSQDLSSLHPAALSGMQMHVYPFPNALLPSQQPLRAKRRQVKNACTHCQKACKKCDDARPCLRCVKYGISEECVDSQRKERKKGVKRGPYKKRDGKGSSVNRADTATTVSNTLTPGGPPVPGPYLPIGYHPGLYGQYPKSGDSPPSFNPPYFLAPPHIQPELPSPTDADGQTFSANGLYEQPPLLASMQYQTTYPISESDGVPSSPQYPVYAKAPSDVEQGETVDGADSREEEQEDASKVD